jgi:hypothetical protein
MDSACYLRNCTQPGQLTEQTPKIKNLCQVPVTVDEDVDGCEFILLLIAFEETNKLARVRAASWWRYWFMIRGHHSKDVH